MKPHLEHVAMGSTARLEAVKRITRERGPKTRGGILVGTS